MSQPEGSDNQAESALQQQKAATIQALQADRRKIGVLRLAKQVQHGMSAAIDVLPSKTRHACAPGCFFCCYLPVDVLAPEAFLIAAHLKRTHSPKELAALVYRLGAHSQHNFGTRPCIFLAKGECSIYEVRPMVCRGYNSLSKERCEDFHHDASIDLRGTKDRAAGRLASMRNGTNWPAPSCGCLRRPMARHSGHGARRCSKAATSCSSGIVNM